MHGGETSERSSQELRYDGLNVRDEGMLESYSKNASIAPPTCAIISWCDCSKSITFT
jgi:hypothetical protein